MGRLHGFVIRDVEKSLTTAVRERMNERGKEAKRRNTLIEKHRARGPRTISQEAVSTVALYRNGNDLFFLISGNGVTRRVKVKTIIMEYPSNRAVGRALKKGLPTSCPI